MKKIMLLILALCLACPGLTGFAMAEDAGEVPVILRTHTWWTRK